nr:polysaccharide deacetylase [Cohnella sp. WQ 127256]
MSLRSEHSLEFGICKVLVKKYSGDGILCEEGTWIKDGDWIGELHLNNERVLALTREVGADRGALQTARQLRVSLKAISEALETRIEMTQVKALIGVTLLHRGLTHGLGFEQQQLPSKRFEKLSTLYLRLLLRCMHPEGLERIERSKDKLTPLLLVYPRAALIQKYQVKPKLRWVRSYSENAPVASVISS